MSTTFASGWKGWVFPVGWEHLVAVLSNGAYSQPLGQSRACAAQSLYWLATG